MQIEYIYRQEDESTIKELFDDYNSGRYSLPMLVVVKKGFYGHREETTFSTGQVLRLHELRCQGRALVHDSQKKTLSVPLDYTYRFTVERSTETLSLRQVVELYGHKLPVKIRFADPDVQIDRGVTVTNGKAFGQLDVVGVHEESFFLANTIDRGTPLDTVLPIPLYLKEVTFCPVLGIKDPGAGGGGQDGALRSALASQKRQLAHVDFSLDYSDKEMVQISQKPLKVTDDYYHNIEHNVYINVTQSRRHRKSQQHQHDSGTYEDVSCLSASGVSFTGKAHHSGEAEDIYVNLREVEAELPPPLPPKRKDSACSPYSHPGPLLDDVYEPVATASDPPLIQNSSSSATMTHELAEAIRKGRGNLRRVSETLAKTPDTASDAARKPEGMITPEGGDTQAGKPPPVKLKPTTTPKPSKPVSADSGQRVKPPTMAKPVHNYDTPRLKSPPQTKPEPEAAQSTALPTKEALNKMPAKHLPPATKPSRPLTAGVKPMSPGKETVTSPKEVPAAVTPSVGDAGRTVTPSVGDAGRTATYTNTQEMAVVKPMPSNKQDDVGKPAPGTGNYGAVTKSQQRGTENTKSQPALCPPEMTTELKKKRVCDVGEVLDKLGLNKYKKTFEDNRVDGVYLTMLNEQILREDFQMNGIDMLKLMTFIQTGHIPQC